MKAEKCPVCGPPMKRDGKTGAGTQRWRCGSRGASPAHRCGSEAKEPGAFPGWLLSKGGQASMPGGGRAFRRRAEKFWRIWPMPEVADGVHRVVYVGGIYAAGDLAAPIACGDSHVPSWYMAKAETTRARRALLPRIAPPEVVVADGGGGFASAVAAEWPETRVQRCLFHAFCQVKGHTTSRPRLQAGIGPYGLAKEPMRLDTLRRADWRVERCMQRCGFRADFPERRTVADGRSEYAHERLRRARPSLPTLVGKGALLTHPDPALTAEGPPPRTNDRIEGGANAQLGDMLRNHRGLSDLRRVKAVCWRCYMHAERPTPAARIVREMPADDDIDLLHETYAGHPRADGGPEWGEAPVWQELRHQTPYPYATY